MNIIFEGLKHQFLENILNHISSSHFPIKITKKNYITAQKEEMLRMKREEYLKDI